MTALFVISILVYLLYIITSPHYIKTKDGSVFVWYTSPNGVRKYIQLK